MNCTVIYWSRYGNGKKIVDYLSEKLDDKGSKIQVFKTDEANPSSMPQSDLYLFSAPTEAFNIQKNMRNFMKKLEGMDGRKYGIINTHGMNRNWLNKMEKLLSKKNMVKVACVDFQVGKNANSGNGLMDNWESKVDDFIEVILENK
jgi:flavodoxin